MSFSSVRNLIGHHDALSPGNRDSDTRHPIGADSYTRHPIGADSDTRHPIGSRPNSRLSRRRDWPAGAGAATRRYWRGHQQPRESGATDSERVGVVIMLFLYYITRKLIYFY